MRRIRACFIVGFALVTAVACADDGPWGKPNVSDEQMAADRTACQRAATEEAERNLVLDEERRSSARNTRTGTYMSQMNRFSAGRDRDDLFDRCMARKGYTRPTSDPKSKFETQSAPQTDLQSQPR